MTRELAIDYALALAVNIGAQALFYPQAITAGRASSFTVLVVGLMFVRRWGTRNAFAMLWPVQTRLQSLVEVGADTVLGWCVAVAAQVIVYGNAATAAKVSGLTALCYVATMGRRYVLRRAFA